MTSLDSARPSAFFADDTWTWWQARRLGYNLVLAAGGWAAFGLAVAIGYGFGRTVFPDWRAALSSTIFLGTGYLVVMGFANVAYLLGPAVEAWLKPADVDRYRRTAFAMGLWGSLAVPFLFPLVQLGGLVAKG